MLPLDENNVPSEKIFEIAREDAQRNQASQPDSSQGNQEDQRIPYERFKEVNDERKQLQEQLANFMALSARQPVNEPPVTQTPVVEQRRQLFSDDELTSFETDIVLDPKATLQKFGEVIMQRGVEAKTAEIERKFEERLSQMSAQMATSQLPNILGNFKQSRFDQSMAEEAAVFDNFVKDMDPAILTNPATLENVRLAALGYVADQRRSNPSNNHNNLPFSETPGGRSGGFGGLGGPQQNAVPQQVIAMAQRMGLDPKDISSLYGAMDRQGVFR